MKYVLAVLALGLCLPLAGADKELFEVAEAKAETGDADAQSTLGWMYLKGEGVEKDGKEAFKWYQKAADQGNAHAQSNLGWMYLYGEGVAEDKKEALKWYRKAADQGNAHAQYFLGSRYYQGKGVLKDYVTAYAWWNIAVANNNAPPIVEMAATSKANIAKKMTPEQIAKAEALVQEMVKKNPELLK